MHYPQPDLLLHCNLRTTAILALLIDEGYIGAGSASCQVNEVILTERNGWRRFYKRLPYDEV